MNPSIHWLGALATAALAAFPAAARETPTFSEIVQPYVDQGRFAGAVAVVILRDKVVAFPVAGYADVATKKPMTRDTVFWIASTSKPIQVTALMMLVDDGKVRLDDPVRKHLPAFDARITVRMLLNHTSGLDPNYSRSTPVDGMRLVEYVDELATRPLRHEPGTSFYYSDAGVGVASRIVEVVSGKPFEQFLDERLLSPLGMKDTTFIPTAAQVERLASADWVPPETGKLTAVPDALAQPRPRAQLADRSLRHAPLGGLFSTAPDLTQFARLFLNEGVVDGKRYLSAAAVAEMTKNQIPPAAASSVPQPPTPRDLPVTYGLGWGISATGAYFHPGMSSTDIRIDPARGIATIFLPQHGGDATVLEMQDELRDALEEHFPLQR